MSRSLSPVVAALAACFAVRALATPVINEIMFHPPGVVENRAQEWIEIYNDSPTSTFNLTGWQFTKGVSFTFPNGTSLAPGGYLVVAADVAAFQTAHPGFAGQLVGGWTGTLANSGENVQLSDAVGAKIDEVHYADEGEWALRGRGALSFSHRGWDWFTDADGGGKTLELRNPALSPFDCGQNWGVSAAVGGSPGAINSVASANVAPLIKDVKHKPDVPHANEPIVVSCNLHDEGAGATATLFWRLDGTTPYNSAPMSDTDGDGDVEATIPATLTNLAIVEFYISATDGTNARTWPAPARTSGPGVLPETFGQVTNALVLVDNSFDANALFQASAAQPIYRLIMTAAEKAELLQIQTNGGQADSEAAMNATFISHDGTGVKVHYLIGIRNRGTGSRLGPPNNYNVGFRNDDLWEERGSLQLNCRYPHSQVLGALCFELAGIAPQESAAVRVRVNGVDLAEPGLRMYGRYARNETMSGDWAKQHYPNDPDGNVYFLDDHNPGAAGVPAGNLGSGEFRYEGTNPLAYSDTYIKKTNEDLNDYSDLIALTDKLTNTPDATFPGTIAPVFDLDQFYTFIATDALIGNQEGGLQTGRADDVGLYRGLVDKRFKMIPHDFDSVFAFGLNGQDPGGPGGGGGFGDPYVRSIFSYDGQAPTSGGDGVLGLHRLFSHPELVPRYYAKLLEQMDKWYNHATLDPLIDQLYGVPPLNWVAATGTNVSIASAKAYITARTTNVLSQIQQNYSLAVTTGVANTTDGYLRTNDGSATFSGTFNVAKTYSITVNGVLAQWFYRTAGADAAGTWKLIVPAGGGSVLRPGVNHVVVNFYDAINGGGNVLQSFAAEISYMAAGTNVAGTISAGSLRVLAPASYIPGKPFLVRVDQLDGQGNLDRTAWDTTVTLSSNVGGITLPNVPLYNGTGSALVTAGGSGGAPPTVFFSYGTGGTGITGSGVAGSQWKEKSDFDTATLATFITNFGTTWKNEGFNDSTWTTVSTQAGYGNNDENTLIPDPDYDAGTVGSQNVPCFLFRSTFTIADVNALASVTGQIKYDDAYAIYVNGQDINQRSANLPAGTALSAYATGTSADNATAAVTIPLAALHNGVNTIAVEIHQGNATSGDVTFDLQLQANYPSSDPGTFTLTAAGAGFAAQKTITSLGSAPAMTTATGAIAANTTWNGVVHVTGNVTVNTGVTLTVAAGTHVLLDGNATAGSTTGTSITVNGTLVTQGTLANPVNIAPFVAGDKWGQILFSNAQPSTLNFTLLNGAGHSPIVGHTQKGPMLRLNTTNVSLLDSVLADGPAKAIYTEGTCNLTIQRSLIDRMITGPELESGCSLLVEDSNIQHILPDFRESNDALANDEDCLYVHNPTGVPVIVRRSVFARCGDDVFDGLGGPLVVEKSILREGWDKGMSLLNNDLTISDTQIIRCDKAIVPKSNTAATRTINVTNCTIVSENHDSSIAPWGYTGGVNGGDPDSPSTGFYTQNKAGQSDPGATLAITAKNCIVIAQQPVLIDAPYNAANTVVTYSDLRLDTGAPFAWPGTGNISTDPLFVAAGTNDYHLTASSPARDTGDPASPLDADGSRADMGALPFAGGGGGAPATVTWTTSGSPYHVTGDITIPSGTTLVINPGVSVQFDQNRKLNVVGAIKALGTAGGNIVFSHVPNTVAAGDADPITPGVQSGPPKWAGITVTGPSVGPAITGSEFRYCQFINAQPAVAAGNTGSLGIIRAEALIDHCIFLGTHLRQVYGENCSLQVQYTSFVDPFDPANDNDNPVAYALDNIAEPLKVANANFPANPNYTDGLPNGGHFRVWYCDFYGNKGHNDVFDADAGVLGRSAVLDCRYNYFHGFTGDEHIDLGGDAYIASNIFERGHKDQWTNDHGYSNCISSGDKGSGTSIWVVRNVAFNVDHMINCKVGTATIFEHNTISDFHADFSYVSGFTQDVKCSAINLFVPDDTGPQPGDGAYAAFNLFNNMPRIITWADLPNGTTSKIEAANNYLNNITDNSVGPIAPPYSGGTQHPGGFTSIGSYVAPGDPQFVNPAGKNYALNFNSPALGTAPGGLDYGASVAEWAYILGGPAATTGATSANFTIGGPGMVAYKWRLDGGSWSAPMTIGTGLAFPRGATPTVRQATLSLNSLTAGAHTLEVLGQDPAGNWQDADPARTAAGLPQAAPTARTWTIDTVASLIRINEVLADSPTVPDTIELVNLGTSTVNIGGWSLSDDPLTPNKYVIPANTMLAAGNFFTVTSAISTINLDKDGDSVYLRNGATLVDSITFGHQIPDFSIGRLGPDNAWALCQPTFGAANVKQRLGIAASVRINEWFTSGDVLYDNDWIELANAGPLPVALAGLRLTDNSIGDPSAAVLPPLSFIAANGFLKLIADGHPELGATHLNFSLDSQQEEIALLSATGVQLDYVFFYPQTTDYSQGRDDDGNVIYYELPTAGLINGTSDPGYANALALLHGLRVTEIMFNAIGGSDYDYVELRNVGAVALQIGGVKFVQGIDFTFPAMTLNAGQSVIVCKQLTKFRARYGPGPVVAGTYSGQLDNGGEILGLQLPPPFDANILTFGYSDGWYASTDGFGTSLVVFDPLAKANVWGDRDTWRASVENGGDPGGFTARTDTYSGWSALHGVLSVTADDDKDGVPALAEYGLGMDVANPNGGNGAAGAPFVTVNGNGHAELHFLVPVTAAQQGHGMAEAVYNVQASSNLTSWTTIATKTFTTNWTGTVNFGAAGGGFLPVVVEDTVGGTQRYLRLQVAWVP